MAIEVERVNDGTFQVTVQAGATTIHKVTVAPEYHQRLTGGKVSEEELVKQSFAFLLEREPNTSILRQFDLPVIQSYFPEYEKTMKRQIG